MTYYHNLNIMEHNKLMTKIDLSQYCPTEKVQYRATCYAYAFAYTALTINYCVKNNIVDKAMVEANAFSPGFIASRHRQQTNFNLFCGRNGTYDVGLKIFAQDGCPKLHQFPSDCTTNIPKEVLLSAKEVQLKQYEYLILENDALEKNVKNIKAVLSQKTPVLIVLNTTDSFADIGRECLNSTPILKNGKKSSTSHDICIIGYDDDLSSKFFGRFLIKNNYKYWGDERNMAWIRYEDMMYMITYALYFTIK